MVLNQGESKPMSRETRATDTGSMETHTETTTPQQPRSRSRGGWFILLVVAIAAGLYVYASVLRSVRYEIEVGKEQLFAGHPDSLHIRAYGVNRHEGRVPFSQPSITVVVLEGGELVRIIDSERLSSVLLVYDGIGEGEVLLRVHIEGWPFPMLTTIRISTPVADAGRSEHIAVN
ncbi:MAG: hypothetical protein KFH87_06345 [Bacteroidetes bacterium]|nr:hypothetical protein [Bacteroidota bacterium]